MAQEDFLTPGTKVWCNSEERAGMVVRTERDHHYGPQYLVSFHEPDTIENTHPYEQRWIKNTDVVSYAAPKKENNRGR